MQPATIRALAALATVLLASGCESDRSLEPGQPSYATAATPQRIPLTDLATGTYLGFKGGLYNGSNLMPAKHDSLGMAAARRIKPLDSNGTPSPGGKIVLLSIGMSSALQEFCGRHSTGGHCNGWTFAGRAMVDPQKSPAVILVNGADGGQEASLWESPGAANYVRVRGELAAQGVTDQQVQVIWLKVVNKGPTIPLPAANADAYNLERSEGNIVRTLKTIYPNLQQIFFMSRIYAGYTTMPNNPEPFAYESGFSAKWIVAAQVRQMLNGKVDPIAGNLDNRTVAPWIAWGPYLWANGTSPRSDGLTWKRSEFEVDGFHPSQTGETKVGQYLLDFFTQSRHTGCWYHGIAC